MSSVGLSPYLANSWLNMLRGTAFTAPSAIYAQLHTAVPGAAGTTGLSAGTATGTASDVRKAIAHAAASGGSLSITGTAPSWSCSVASVSETLAYISFWDAVSSGNFLWAAALNSSRAWATGDTYTLSTDVLSLAPIAAN
ncbi:hypothetical protein [Gordonia sp. N1V]|uniref:phage tail fiber protein n=1 Tax=Gordonia sp. N1V TaxID=3034163 RepID=UPI0023E0B01E|nr:hypothetical protein [Gordonia sp. N1V]MDF3280928.1 hypothetical protein [Gordonia sp. N1V]